MSKETELSDEQIDNCVGNLGMAENSILVGPEEIRKAMRAVIAADRELRRGDAGMPVIAYLRATASGEPIWTDDCVCQDAVFPSDPDGSDENDVSMPMVRQSDAQAALAAKDAEIIAAEAENASLRLAVHSTEIRIKSLQQAQNQHDEILAAANREIAGLRKEAGRSAFIRRHLCDKNSIALEEAFGRAGFDGCFPSESEFNMVVDAAIAKEAAK